MASCSEVDHSVDALGPGKKAGGPEDPAEGPSPAPPPVPECAICLQTCVHPVRLPCQHVFCFLCVKGASWHSKRCALCRQEVPEDFLERPALLSPEELKASAARRVAGDDHAWYYEGRNGWWQYDERTSRELEEALSKGKKSAEMLIAGFLYVADLENMVQYRRNEHGRRRRMKRDALDIPKKGVAGLRLEPDPAPTGALGRSQGGFAPPPVRPATVLGGHPGSPTSPSPPSLPNNSPLEESLSQLQISQQEEEAERGEEEEVVLPPQAHNYESASGSSEEEEEGGVRDGGQGTRSRHRLLQRFGQRQPERPPPGGGSSSSRGVRSRSPDGQCTVTEV